MMELEVEAEVVGMPVMEEVGRLSESLGLGLADVPILSAENRSLCGDLASLRVEARRLAAEVDQGWFQESTLIPVVNFDDICDNNVTKIGIKSFKVQHAQEGDEAQLLHGHHEEVDGATKTARALALSRKQEARAETDLGRIARMERERVRDIELSIGFIGN